MTEMNETKVHDTTSSRGAQWATAGSVIALAAQSLLGNGGALGGILGGPGARGGAPAAGANEQVLALAVENAQLKADAKTDAKIAELTALVYAKDKAQDGAIIGLNKRIDEVAHNATLGISTLGGAVASLQATVGGITKTVVPNTSACPGWGTVTIAPSTTTTTA